ncbi:MAG: Crp/Fnr family transcriptional regulator, partial [Alphaproteobacteria bacterium]
RSIDFNEEEAELHETVFQNFSPVEFRKLMRIGEWRNAAQGDQLTAQGAIVGGLNLLFNGEVLVERDGAEIGRARDGAMIGEISFIQGGPATATVSATKPCRYVSWSGDELRKLLTRNPSMDIAMKHVFSIDLMRKLTV